MFAIVGISARAGGSQQTLGKKAPWGHRKAVSGFVHTVFAPMPLEVVLIEESHSRPAAGA